MKNLIVKTANRLCELLSLCDDDSFVDEVIMRVSCNDPFDEDYIGRAEEE